MNFCHIITTCKHTFLAIFGIITQEQSRGWLLYLTLYTLYYYYMTHYSHILVTTAGFRYDGEDSFQELSVQSHPYFKIVLLKFINFFDIELQGNFFFVFFHYVSKVSISN